MVLNAMVKVANLVVQMMIVASNLWIANITLHGLNLM